MGRRVDARWAIVIGLFVASCAQPPLGQQPPDDWPPGGPNSHRAVLAPDRVRVEPPEVRAGDVVELHVAEPTARGRAYALERREGDGWEVHYYLDEGTWWYAGADVAITDDIVTDPVVRLPIPGDAAGGRHRICTTEGECAPVTIR